MSARYDARQLITFAAQLLARGGMDEEKAQCVAEVLVEGDLLGHTTHGLHLVAPYLRELEAGTLTKTGDPEVLADFPAAVTWDGKLLPGPWLVTRAIDLAMQRAKQLGTCTVCIRRSHHIACLEAFLKRVTDAGLMILLTCSDPHGRGVAPHGATRDAYTPDPIAAAWPTDGDPVMLDVSMSVTSLGLAHRLKSEGRKLPGKWLIDPSGNLTDDPKVLDDEPAGALLPLGGIEHGHKGYAMALLVEALTSGLCGFGRADGATGWQANVFIQILDPRLFGGREAFTRETSWLADYCRALPTREGFDKVRLPGERGLKRRAEQLANGVELYPSIMPAIEPWAKQFGVALP